MNEPRWHQLNIAYPGADRQQREEQGVEHLASIMPAAEDAGLITSWWFMRKGLWRVRYVLTQPPNGTDPVHLQLSRGYPSKPDIYEPEIPAFGGPKAIQVAHKLFHADSRHALEYLADHPANRRERSVVLCTALMRSAGLDLEEQGDVWAQVAEFRAAALSDQPLPDPPTWTSFTASVRQLILGTPHADQRSASWHREFANAGSGLHTLRTEGALARGLRAVIAKHLLFHWNRIGLSAATQAILAQAAKEAIFGHAPKHTPRPG